MASELAPTNGHRTHNIGDVSTDIEYEPVQHDSHKKKFRYACYGLIVAILIIIGLLIATIYFATVVENDNKSESSSTDSIIPDEVDVDDDDTDDDTDDSLLQPLCDTDQCFNLASDILRSINASADPCNNFAEFVCGGWVADNNWELSKYDRYTALSEMDRNMREVFLETIVVENPLWKEPSVAAAKLYYDSCYSSEVTEEDLQNEELLQEFIQMVNFSDYNFKNQSLNASTSEIYSMEWDAESARGFQLAMAWAHNHRFDDLYQIYIFSEGIVDIEQNAFLWLFYNRSDLEDRMAATFIPLYESLFGLTEDEALLVAELVLDFADQVFAITTADDNYLDFSLRADFMRNTTMDELNNLMGGQVGLLDYEQILIDTFRCTDSSCIDSINYLEPGIEFFNNLAILINETSPYIVQYWLFTDILDGYFNYGHNDEFLRQSREDERRDYCYQQILEHFPFVFGYVQDLKEYPTEKFDLALNITKSVLKDGVTALMHEVDWLDEDSLNNSLRKAENMDLYVGIPPNMSNIDAINNYYADISMNLNMSNGFIRNFHLMLERGITIQLAEFRGDATLLHKPWPSIFGVSFIHPFWLTGVNAFYFPVKRDGEKGNYFAMPQTITRDPLFGLNFPMLVNYAAWGTVVGHEITHGFDSRGSTYDWEGNEVEMWTNETRDLYDDKIQCFIDQYDQIEVEPDIFVNGSMTNGENTADNGGMAATRAAYKQWKLDNNIDIDPEQKILPGLEFTEEQLWWISYGRVWCNIHSPGYYDASNYFGVHAPPSARINGVVSNFQEFADAFECSAGSPMNPENKCGLWHN